VTVLAMAGRRDDAGTGEADGWQPFIDALGEAIWLVDAATQRVVAVNQPALRLLDWPREAVLGALAPSLLETVEDAAYWQDASTHPGAELISHTQFIRADGSLRHVERRIRRIEGARGPLLLVAVTDHSDMRRAMDEHEAVLAELRATLESTADGLLVTDLGGHVRAFNRRFAQLWALPEALLLSADGAAIFDWMREQVIDPPDDARRLANIQGTALAQSCDRLTLRSGQVMERVTTPQRYHGQPVGRVYSFRDLSERVAADQRIEVMSFTDLLTGLPNRRYLAARMAPVIALATRQASAFALMLLDLDHFKQINDSLGHDAGDRVLREVGMRLKACLREGDMIARIGGDQFALLLHQADAAGGETGARRLLHAMAQPFTFDGAQFTITCSIGVALFPRDGLCADDLMRVAESAMHQAKVSGRGAFRFHRTEQPVADLRSRIRLDHAMRQALASRRFRLHYQPQIDLPSGRVIGAEALIRWHDPERGDISPAEFIPVAEDSGFIIAIGDWVLEQAVRQAAQWRQRGMDIPVAINVSALQFQHDDFLRRVADVLAAAGLPGGCLELELTESILVRDAKEALLRLKALAQLGVRLSIDDFGTGYSSLAYLKRFPIQKLKIDRSFICNLPGDDSDAGIVRAIIQMAHALNLRVIAEGVETPAQRDFLVHAGCHEYQGFLHGPAVSSLQFEQGLPAPH
jgi:diguanylate cyclase (GGDEF)-like protein